MSKDQVQKGLALLKELEHLRAENKDLKDRLQKATAFVKRLGYQGGVFL